VIPVLKKQCMIKPLSIKINLECPSGRFYARSCRIWLKSSVLVLENMVSRYKREIMMGVPHVIDGHVAGPFGRKARKNDINRYCTSKVALLWVPAFLGAPARAPGGCVFEEMVGVGA